MADKRIWDKGTPFESQPEAEHNVADDDIIWDKGTPFESRQPRIDDHDCALKRGSPLCRVCDLQTIERYSKP